MGKGGHAHPSTRPHRRRQKVKGQELEELVRSRSGRQPVYLHVRRGIVIGSRRNGRRWKLVGESCAKLVSRFISSRLISRSFFQNNAQSQHRINLIHSYTQALKPPYSRSHPHVFSVKECTGALTYFEVGTETIVEEWTITCNYWAARLSQLPLSGGVSNMDYGWGRPTYPGDDDEKVSVARQRTISSGGGGGGGGISTFVNEWNPPFQGTNQSTLGEQEQLQALTEYKKKLVAELEEFRPMDRYLVSPFPPA